MSESMLLCLNLSCHVWKYVAMSEFKLPCLKVCCYVWIEVAMSESMLPCLKLCCHVWNYVAMSELILHFLKCCCMFWNALTTSVLLLSCLKCCCCLLLSPCGGWPHLNMAGRGGGSDPLWQHHLLGLQQFTLTTHTQSLIRGPLLGRTYTNITIIYQGSGSGSSMVHIIWAPDPGSDLVYE